MNLIDYNLIKTTLQNILKRMETSHPEHEALQAVSKKMDGLQLTQEDFESSENQEKISAFLYELSVLIKDWKNTDDRILKQLEEDLGITKSALDIIATKRTDKFKKENILSLWENLKICVELETLASQKNRKPTENIEWLYEHYEYGPVVWYDHTHKFGSSHRQLYSDFAKYFASLKNRQKNYEQAYYLITLLNIQDYPDQNLISLGIKFSFSEKDWLPYRELLSFKMEPFQKELFSEFLSYSLDKDVTKEEFLCWMNQLSEELSTNKKIDNFIFLPLLFTSFLSSKTISESNKKLAQTTYSQLTRKTNGKNEAQNKNKDICSVFNLMKNWEKSWSVWALDWLPDNNLTALEKLMDVTQKVVIRCSMYNPNAFSEEKILETWENLKLCPALEKQYEEIYTPSFSDRRLRNETEKEERKIDWLYSNLTYTKMISDIIFHDKLCPNYFLTLIFNKEQTSRISHLSFYRQFSALSLFIYPRAYHYTSTRVTLIEALIALGKKLGFLETDWEPYVAPLQSILFRKGAAQENSYMPMMMLSGKEYRYENYDNDPFDINRLNKLGILLYQLNSHSVSKESGKEILNRLLSYHSSKKLISAEILTDLSCRVVKDMMQDRKWSFEKKDNIYRNPNENALVKIIKLKTTAFTAHTYISIVFVSGFGNFEFSEKNRDSRGLDYHYYSGMTRPNHVTVDYYLEKIVDLLKVCEPLEKIDLQFIKDIFEKKLIKKENVFPLIQYFIETGNTHFSKLAISYLLSPKEKTYQKEEFILNTRKFIEQFRKSHVKDFCLIECMNEIQRYILKQFPNERVELAQLLDKVPDTKIDSLLSLTQEKEFSKLSSSLQSLIEGKEERSGNDKKGANIELPFIKSFSTDSQGKPKEEMQPENIEQKPEEEKITPATLV